MVTLGLNLLGNDTSVALLAHDGSIIAVAEEERYSGIKGGRRWASPAWVLEVMTEFGVSPEEVTAVAVARIQALHLLRPPAHHPGPGPRYWSEAKRASLDWLARRLPNCQAVTEVRHHLCHAASAFSVAPFETAAVVTADGVGEVETATIWAPDGNGLRALWSRTLPHSIGLAYEAVARWVGLTGTEKEGKLMGLASLGVPRYRARIHETLLRPDAADVFAVPDAIAALEPTVDAWTSHLEHLFGPPGRGGNEIRDIDADVAASVQVVVEECLAELLGKARALTGERRCTAAGGAFLNAVANGMLDRSGLFEDLWVQPLAGDAGTSLGAALVAHGPRSPQMVMRHAFLGSALGDVDAAARVRGLEPVHQDDLVQRAASLLLDGGILGWASGRSEVGPRALGHRSIFADPRRPEVRETLNARIKERENWRPFAPIVLEEDTSALFGSELRVPYMNKVAPALVVAPIQAAAHADGSARLQTVSADEPELALVRELLLEVKARTGYGVLLNTSLNVRGQPIARTAAEVLDTYRNCGLDGLVLDGRLFLRSGHLPQDRAATASWAGRSCPDEDGAAPGASEWWLVTPWSEPEPAVARRSLERAGYGRPGLRPVQADDAGFGERLRRAAAAGEVGGVVVVAPVWSELAAMSADGLLPGWFRQPWRNQPLPIVFLDEDGRVAEWDGLQADGLAEVTQWWSARRRTPTAPVPRAVSASAAQGGANAGL